MDAYDRFDERHSQYEDEPMYDCESCGDTGAWLGAVGVDGFERCPDCELRSVFAYGKYQAMNPEEYRTFKQLEDVKRAIYAWRRAA